MFSLLFMSAVGACTLKLLHGKNISFRTVYGFSYNGNFVSLPEHHDPDHHPVIPASTSMLTIERIVRNNPQVLDATEVLFSPAA